MSHEGNGTPPRVDVYGFSFNDDEEYEAYLKALPALEKSRSQQIEKWKTTPWDFTASAPQRDKKLKKLIRGGIPDAIRPKVWMNVSGANAIKDNSKQQYLDYALQPFDTEKEYFRQIDLDVPRTFTDREDFLDKEGAMQKSLRRVLGAYAHRNTSLGYCQGLNFLVGGFFIASLSEEEAFWLLCATIENMLPQNYFEGKLQGLRTDALVLYDILRRKLPAVAHIVEKGSLSPEVLFSQWLLCMFSTVFPCQTFLRIWDAFFYEGVKVLFRACIAYLQRVQKLLDAESPDDLLRHIYNCKVITFDTDNFMDEVFNHIGSFPWAHIEKLRETNGQRVSKQELTFSLMRSKLSRSASNTPRDKLATGSFSFHRR